MKTKKVTTNTFLKNISKCKSIQFKYCKNVLPFFSPYFLKNYRISHRNAFFKLYITYMVTFCQISPVILLADRHSRSTSAYYASIWKYRIHISATQLTNILVYSLNSRLAAMSNHEIIDTYDFFAKYQKFENLQKCHELLKSCEFQNRCNFNNSKTSHTYNNSKKSCENNKYVYQGLAYNRPKTSHTTHVDASPCRQFDDELSRYLDCNDRLHSISPSSERPTSPEDRRHVGHRSNTKTLVATPESRASSSRGPRVPHPCFAPCSEVDPMRMIEGDPVEYPDNRRDLCYLQKYNQYIGKGYYLDRTSTNVNPFKRLYRALSVERIDFLLNTPCPPGEHPANPFKFG